MRLLIAILTLAVLSPNLEAQTRGPRPMCSVLITNEVSEVLRGTLIDKGYSVTKLDGNPTFASTAKWIKEFRVNFDYVMMVEGRRLEERVASLWRNLNTGESFEMITSMNADMASALLPSCSNLRKLEVAEGR